MMKLNGEGILYGGNYETCRPPSYVLNVLETEGYKVVGTNTVTDKINGTLHHLLWTLHKQA